MLSWEQGRQNGDSDQSALRFSSNPLVSALCLALAFSYTCAPNFQRINVWLVCGCAWVGQYGLVAACLSRVEKGNWRPVVLSVDWNLITNCRHSHLWLQEAIDRLLRTLRLESPLFLWVNCNSQSALYGPKISSNLCYILLFCCSWGLIIFFSNLPGFDGVLERREDEHICPIHYDYGVMPFNIFWRGEIKAHCNRVKISPSSGQKGVEKISSKNYLWERYIKNQSAPKSGTPYSPDLILNISLVILTMDWIGFTLNSGKVGMSWAVANIQED